MISAYFKDLLKVLGIGAGFATIPLMASFAAVEPPWPPAIGELSGAAVLIASLVAWEWAKGTEQSRHFWMIAGIVATLIGLVGYLYLYSQFVDVVPGSTARILRGYECTANAKVVYGTSCPNLPSDALEGAEWESTELWTRNSITKVRMMLALAWLIFTCGLVIVVGSVVAGRKI